MPPSTQIKVSNQGVLGFSLSSIFLSNKYAGETSRNTSLVGQKSTRYDLKNKGFQGILNINKGNLIIKTNTSIPFNPPKE